MIESLTLFFNTFKHHSEDQDEPLIGRFELLGISWALHLLYAFYSVFAIYLGVKSYEYFSQSTDFSHLIFDSFHFEFQKIGLVSTLFSAAFYPLVFQFSYKFWKGCFRFYANIFDYDCDDESLFNEKGDEVLSSAYTANFLLILPVVGSVLSQIAFAYFLFRGLKRKYDFSLLQASLVLITPLFILFLFAVLTASYFVFLLSLL